MISASPKKEPKIVDVSLLTDEEQFWSEFGKNALKDAITGLDDRAKYMITTCASLIVIHFGILQAFTVGGTTLNIVPEFFFAVSAASFATSYYPVSKPIKLEYIESIKNAHKSWIRWKLLFHKIGFGFFIAGLLAMAVTTMTQDISSSNGT